MPDTDVSAERPDSPIQATGTDHITVIGSNPEDTIAFYRDLLGMPLVLRQPNLDQPEVEHLFFDTGDGRVLTFFVADRASDPRPVTPAVGGVHHLAFRVDPEKLDSVKRALADAGHRYSEFDRGAFHSLYTRDHNGLTIELATEVFEIADADRAEVLALAQQKRVEAGAEYARAEDVRAALEELGLPVVETAAGRTDADAGTGITE